MADIHVQTKKNTTPVWLWILLVLIIAAVIYFITRNKDKSDNKEVNQNTTSYIYVKNALPVNV
jgi:lipopolysaccharide export system protein LptC